MTFRKALKGLAVILFLVVAFVVISNIWIIQSTEVNVFYDVRQVPYNQVALVLGTSNKLTDGSPNPFFENRIRTAALLYHQKKVSHFILSGDNRTQYYNEPFAMKRALMKLGVPDSVITLDYAGLRTLDSVVRSKEIFGQDKLTIITQSFHCYRALFISAYYDIKAIAIITSEQPREDAPFVYLREYFARTKAVLDLYILKTAPRHLGDKEHLDI
ncbi:MAG TPA: ElyC/SanA/YdcF family protein [Cyclobacteriaceae bacterium]|jgi:SanA protein|nr:ElyC/SanA/YdcF family protein [Cyclobacteriaceae bacterium]